MPPKRARAEADALDSEPGIAEINGGIGIQNRSSLEIDVDDETLDNNPKRQKIIDSNSDSEPSFTDEPSDQRAMKIPELSSDEEENNELEDRNTRFFVPIDPFTSIVSEDTQETEIVTDTTQKQTAELAQKIETETLYPTEHANEFESGAIGYGYISSPNVILRLEWTPEQKAMFCQLIGRLSTKNMYEIAERVGKSVMECQAYLDILNNAAKKVPKSISYADIEAAVEVPEEMLEATPPPSPSLTTGVVQQPRLDILDVNNFAEVAGKHAHHLTEKLMFRLCEISEELTVEVGERAISHQNRTGAVTAEHMKRALTGLPELRSERDINWTEIMHGNNSKNQKDEYEPDSESESSASDLVDSDHGDQNGENGENGQVSESIGKLQNTSLEQKETRYLEALDTYNRASELHLEAVPRPVLDKELAEFMRL